MARPISSAFRAQLAAGFCRPRLFLEMESTGGWLRFWTGGYDYDVWLGNGLFKSPGQISSSGDDMPSMKVELASEPAEIIELAATGLKSNHIGKLYLGFVDENFAVISTVDLLFSGRLDQVSLEDSRDESTLTLTYANEMAALFDSNVLRYTHETQQQFYPGDLGFEYMSQMEDISLFWGRPEKKAGKETKPTKKTPSKTSKGK